MHDVARLTTLTRLGFAARGLLYLVIATLVLTTGRTEDPAGALRYLGQGGGRILLILMALGLLAYGLWRLSDAVFDIERHGQGGQGLAERAGAAVSGIVHLLLAWQAVRLMRGAGSASADAKSGAASVLELPGGSLLLIVAGVAIAATGIYQMIKAAKGSYLEHLEPRAAGAAWVQWAGRLGYAARGLIFLIAGVFLVGAGTDERASDAAGMAEVLGWLSSPLDLIIAAGLFGFGLFSLVEARFRVLHNVEAGGIAHRIGAKFR